MRVPLSARDGTFGGVTSGASTSRASAAARHLTSVCPSSAVGFLL